jgi:hypothetical protein
MLKMVNQLDNFTGEPGSDSMPYKAIRKQFPESMPGRAAITFSSKRKRMSTLVPMPCFILQMLFVFHIACAFDI